MRLRSTALRLAAGIGLMLISAAAALAVSALVAGRGRSHGSAAPPGSLSAFPAATEAAHAFDRAELLSSRLGPGESYVARARRGAVHVRATRHGRRSRTLRGLRVGHRRAPLVFLVKRRARGWVQVYLPVRPDRATGWVRAREVRLTRSAYRLEVRLRSHRLLAWRRNRLVASVRIGTGRAVTPTPHGRYFVADLLKPPDPHGFYGPYAFGLSAYSHVLTRFAGGRGQIGIHGTNVPAALGTNVSHGCIRVRNSAITRLAREVPLGSPVTIRA